MHTVWIAKTESWDGSLILGVYSTESLAQAAVEKHMAKCDAPRAQLDKFWNTVIKFEIDQDAISHGYLVDTTKEGSTIIQHSMDTDEAFSAMELKL